MKYAVIKTYEVEAISAKQAEYIVEELEKKNQQGLFLRLVSSFPADGDEPIWKLW